MISPKKIITIIPLSYNSTLEEIEKFFKQFETVKEEINVIVILENNDSFGQEIACNVKLHEVMLHIGLQLVNSNNGQLQSSFS